MMHSARAVGALMAACLVLAGCSGDSDSSTLPVREPATAAVAAGTTAPPAGTVTPLNAAVRHVAIDPRTRVLALAVDSPDRLLLLNADAVGTPPRTVALPGRAAQLSLSAPGGPLFVAVPGAVLRVDQRSGVVTSTKVDADVRSAVQLSDGATAVGTADGKVLVLGPDGAVRQQITGLAETDGLADTLGGLVAMDRKQSALRAVDLGKGKLGESLRAGDGATNAVTDRFGRILVTDTAGGELLAFSTDPLLLRQRFPVPGAPYALAYDPATDLAWVTITERNQVVGYAMAAGEPVERYRFDSVAQPDTVAVDPATGAVLVGSAAGAGLQRIDPKGGGR